MHEICYIRTTQWVCSEFSLPGNDATLTIIMGFSPLSKISPLYHLKQNNMKEIFAKAV